MLKTIFHYTRNNILLQNIKNTINRLFKMKM